MPQINDTTGNQKTSTVMRIDAKAENFERIPIQRGLVDIIEGGIMVRNATGKAAAPNTGGGSIIDLLIYLNFANPNAGGAYDRQVVNDVGGTQFSTVLEGGGYVGISGADLRIGLPLTERFFVKADLVALAVPGARIVLKRELDAAAEFFNEVKFGVASGAAGILIIPTANQGGLCFGITESVDGSVIWFIHSNRGINNNPLV
jgi:hypothetical protein